MKLVATDTKVTIKWFVYAGGEKIARQASMRGTWAYDATCSCGWETKSGGGVLSYIQNEVEMHKMREHNYTYIFKSEYAKVGA